MISQPEKENKYDKWKVESALRTLKEAELLKKDKKMMSLVGKLAKKEMSAISSVADLRAASEKLDSADG